MARKETLKVQDILDTLERNQGLVALTAQSLKVSLQTVYNYRDRYPSIAKKIKELRERRTDRVELQLYDKINAGDTTAIIFYLKTQAKERGYVERQELTGAAGSEPITFVIREIKEAGDGKDT